MSGLAEYVHMCGKKVAGCDNEESIYTKKLSDLGIEIFIGTETQKINEYEVIVYTDAIMKNNPVLCEAERQGKVIYPRGKFLNETGKDFKNVIAVAGCHGKTTCCSMLAHIFAASGKSFGAHIGGRDIDFGNFYYCGNDYFITEACEFKKNFLLLEHDIAVILNSDADHLECYNGDSNILHSAYIDFSESAKVTVSLNEDTFGGITFGFDKDSRISACDIKCQNGLYSFSLCNKNENLGEISLNVYGRHNILNALAASAVSLLCGIKFEEIKLGLENFKGVERRFERIGKINSVNCIADYAHHPAEILSSIKTAESITQGEVYVVFQPHTYSRTKNLFNEFVDVFSHVKKLMLYKTFAAREYFDDEGSAFTLAGSIPHSFYGENYADIINFVSTACENDCILFLGAGDIYMIAKELIKKQ